jgi:hypothetical protein
MSDAQTPGAFDDLKDLVMDVLVKRTKGDKKVSIPFIEAFMEACIILNSKTHIVEKEANPMIRNQLLENLLKNDYVILNPHEGEAVFITQKAIDKFYSK